MKKYTRGFTLIELLVVIAIIGILASVVLVSLNSARKKGNDTRVISDVNQVRTQLESDYASANANYPDLTAASTHIDAITSGTPGTTNLNTLTGDAVTQSGGTGPYPSNTTMIIYSTAISGTPTDYAIYGKTSAGYFCIDSKGNTVTNTAQGATLPAYGASAVCS